MTAAEVEEMEVFLDRINRIYRIKIEEALEIYGFDTSHTRFIRPNPFNLCIACGDDFVGIA